MKQIIKLFFVMLLTCSFAVPCYATGTYEGNGDAVTIDVYAKCISTAQHPSVPVSTGTAEIITADGYKVYVSEVPDNAITLKIVSIPSTEKEAWSWFAKCVGDNKTILEIFDIYFEDTDGNRINANGAKIRISKVLSSTAVISVTTSGKSTELRSKSSGDDITFLTDGSHYYVLVRSVEETTGTRYKITVEETSGGVIEVSELEPVAGQIVIIEVIPDAGNVVDTISVCDANGHLIDVIDNSDGTYSFVQPDWDVIVKVNFKAKIADAPVVDLKFCSTRQVIVLSIATIGLILFFAIRTKRRKK